LWYSCIPPCEMHFLLVWGDDTEFSHMMHVNSEFLWIWMMDLISVNLVISCLGSRMQPLMAAKSWLDPGCSRQAGSRLL
jgi:hypothetical protein